ncbi:MAG TPA: agmatine deiminase family protein [Polyangiaceae bacterium]|nr:agmatine deiminase family protein [Polyangiaceae bacterium]
MTSPTESPRALGFRMPAEWEPHAATWLAWPHNRDDWPGKFDVIPAVFVELAKHLAEVERVRFIVEDANREAEVKTLLGAARANVSNVDFFHAPTDRSWTRDFVPIFVKKPGEVAAVKFRFDGWARYDNHLKDDAAGRSVAAWRKMRGFDALAPKNGTPTRVVCEGGGIDVDGEGTLLASEDCLVSGPRGRNPWLGTAGTERVFSETLGVDKVVWVGAGVVGDDTSGHVDDFVRFAGPGRVLLAEEKNPRDANHAPLEESRERLEGARDAKGRKLEILRIPMPSPVMWGEERLPASYSNYYVANGLVLVPVFDDPRDAAALGLIGELFPGRKIVGVRAVDLVLGLGTIHCSTHEEPAV